MSKHGGRRIKIVVWEYAYPHGEEAKRCGRGQEYPIFQTGDSKHPYQRPTNAVEDFIEKCFDRQLANDGVLLKAMGKYWFFDKNLTRNQRLKPEEREVIKQ